MTGHFPVDGLQPESTTYNRIFQPIFAVPTTTDFCTMPPMSQTHIGVRIRECREKVDYSQSDLARALGIKPQAVQKWEAGQSAPRNERLQQIADALSTSVRELIRGTELEGIAESGSIKDAGSSKVFPLRGAQRGAPKDKRGLVPLLSWEQAANWGQTLNSNNLEEAEDWLRCPFNHGTEAFILEVDPSREPVNRSMVVVRVDHEDRVTFKQLLMDEGGTRLLKALNPTWPGRPAPLPDGSRIIGVVIGKWVPE
jgi:transcriptional regulator with XRE-family HTH domain